jgi:hypothetical protein
MKLNSQLPRLTGAVPMATISDRSLFEAALMFPRDTASFKTIDGVDAAKIEKYGHEFLKITSKYGEIAEQIMNSASDKQPEKEQAAEATTTKSKYFSGKKNQNSSSSSSSAAQNKKRLSSMRL